MKYQVLWLPKDGNTPDEYEDAFAPAVAPSPIAGIFAIADGATESSFSQHWAQLLVQAFVDLPVDGTASFADWLPPLQQQWIQTVSGKPLPWYAETKFKAGAFATLLGIRVTDLDRDRGQWHAVAVGDSCLFHVRAGSGFLRTFPLERAEEFDTTPFLVGSRSTGPRIGEIALETAGEWQRSDQLWMMTDALAKWCMQRAEAGERPWEVIEQVLSEPANFGPWIESLWNAQELRNDDITLAAIHLA